MASVSTSDQSEQDLVGGCGFRSGPAVSSGAGCVLGRSGSERTAVDAPRDVARDKLDPRTTPPGGAAVVSTVRLFRRYPASRE